MKWLSIRQKTITVAVVVVVAIKMPTKYEHWTLRSNQHF